MRSWLSRLSLLLLAVLASVAPVSAQDISSQTVAGGAGLPLQVVTAGAVEQPEILFLHGFSLSSSSWTQQFETLGDEYRLVAMDMRGHGNSAHPWEPSAYADSQLWADDVAAVIAATQLRKPWIVAWSYGGHVTLDYIRHYGQDKVAGIVLIGSTAGMQPFPPFDPATTQDFAEQTRLSLSPNSADRAKAARQFVQGMAATPLAEDIIVREAAAALALTPRVRAAMMGRSLDNADLIDSITVPVLFVLGDQDRTASIEGVARLVEQLQSAKMSVYADTGHMPFIERQTRLDDELRRLLDAGLASF